MGLVRFVHPSHGGRTIRYRHVADERWRLSKGELAVLAVLVLRGPQTTGEVRTRTERMIGPDDGTVEEILDMLAARSPEPFAARVARRSGRARSALGAGAVGRAGGRHRRRRRHPGARPPRRTPARCRRQSSQGAGGTRPRSRPRRRRAVGPCRAPGAPPRPQRGRRRRRPLGHDRSSASALGADRRGDRGDDLGVQGVGDPLDERPIDRSAQVLGSGDHQDAELGEGPRRARRRCPGRGRCRPGRRGGCCRCGAAPRRHVASCGPRRGSPLRCRVGGRRRSGGARPAARCGSVDRHRPTALRRATCSVYQSSRRRSWKSSTLRKWW